MPTPTKGPRLGGGPAHERLLLAGLATQLFEHRSITTTEAKAKRLRPFAERLVTFAKRGDLASRRRVLAVVRDKGVVHELFTEIAPAVAERDGGYTRITRIGPRKGDNAPLAVIELVLDPLTARAATVREAEAATGRAARGNRPAGAAVAGGAPAAWAASGTAEDADGAEPVAVEPGAAVADSTAATGDASGATTAEATPAEPAAEPSAGAPAGTAGTIDDPEVTDRAADTPDSPPAKA